MIKSPCIKICKVENNVCVGCKRTLIEIEYWKKMSDTQKQAVLNRIGMLRK